MNRLVTAICWSLSDFVKLSFCSPSTLDKAPERPQDLCTPQLQQLLAPIFDPMTPPASSPASSCDTEPVDKWLLFTLHLCFVCFFLTSQCLCDGAQKSSSEEETMDTTEVEKFFALWKDNGQEQMETQMVNATNIVKIYRTIVYFSHTVKSQWDCQ